MGSTAGFFEGLGQQADERHDRQMKDKTALRDRKADEIEQAIKNIQSDTSMSPQDKAGKIGEAHKQLTGLYEPHEGPNLLDRLKKIAGHKQEAKPSVQLRPGMTLEDVLASGSPKPTGVKSVGSPFKGPDGKWYTIQEDSQGSLKRTEIPGYSEQSEKQQLIDAGLSPEDADKAMRVKYGVEAKPTATHKGMKYDSATDEVVDQDSGERYSRANLSQKDTPEVVRHMFEGATRTQTEKKDQKEQFAQKRFNERLQLQRNAIGARFDAGDYVGGRRELNKVKTELVAAQGRMDTMDENAVDAANGNQQAMLSLVANHIGMTLGAQKGARITRAVWDEAMESAPWLDTKLARYFHEEPDGSRTLLEPLSGVVLTPDQIKQMTTLAHQKVDILKHTVSNTENTFKSELSKGHGTPDKPIADEPKPVAPKKKVSLVKAIALPGNHGKSEADVRKDIEAHGYEVAP